VAEDPATQVFLHLAAAKPRLYPFASFGSLHERGSTPPACSAVHARKAVAEDPATQVFLHLAAAKPRLYPFASFGSLHERGPLRLHAAKQHPRLRLAPPTCTLWPHAGAVHRSAAVPWNPDFLVSA
jgi:hypothetical protein